MCESIRFKDNFVFGIESVLLVFLCDLCIYNGLLSNARAWALRVLSVVDHREISKH